MKTTTNTCALVALLIAAPVFAKLPAPSEADKAKTAETAAKTAWTEKVGAYKTCLAGDRAVENFRKNAAADKRIIPEPNPGVPKCVDPGPYVSTLADASKPLEASGAHSPPAIANTPPSSNTTTAEMSGGVKKTRPD
jgi:hypothetical protein